MGQIEDHIGFKVTKLREAEGFSRRELATRSKLSHTAIKNVEEATQSCTIATLHKISSALNCTFADLLPPEEKQVGKFYRQTDLTRVELDGHLIEQIGANLVGRSLQMMRDTFAPGASTGKAMLVHPGEEAGIVVSGIVEVTVGDERNVLGPGDAYSFASTIPHRFRNPGDEPCVVIAANTPPSL